jgi:predicted nucleotide-binding protein (sugar kinase/HSP70/actin superfamily)
VTATPASVKAAFTKEGDIFAEKGVKWMDTLTCLHDEKILHRQMYDDWKDILGLTEDENFRAVREGQKAMLKFDNDIMRGTARETLKRLEAEDRLGIVLLGRPYHNDPGINHEILEEFQKLGYPVFSQDSLPIDDDIVWKLFGDDVKAGLIEHPLDVSDAWKNSYSENTTRKVWSAKFVARHPNLVALELSSFKCGHDAPIYTAIEEIVEHSGTPYFCFKDIDENKPTGSIKIRVETIGYFLKRYRENMVREKQKKHSVDEQLAKFEEQLRHELRLAASLGGEKGSCGTHDSAPAELVGIQTMQPSQNELVELAGD